ncbi:hypothetical protein DFJ43DRAFT_1102184 [Lentinula guzmanii]|uniref:Uncharacterized protein n=1 Tax=Lentinula guzmanii TaxID=2804957 RepID=A0AA38JE35_9AGAR|nr:hypothetical protein DFJ43DRAFT_1102184 [Lentinula guzmanii]
MCFFGISSAFGGALCLRTNNAGKEWTQFLTNVLKCLKTQPWRNTAGPLGSTLNNRVATNHVAMYRTTETC